MAENINYVFRRIEAKYNLPKERSEMFREELTSHMQMDEYGLTTICNLYYDTPHFDLISRSLEKPDYKEKLRLRSYGVPTPDSQVFVELKKKYKGIVYKRRTGMSLTEAEAFLNEGKAPKEDSQINREVGYFLSFYQPVPSMVLCYEREAFYGKEDPTLRVTIDRDICYREKDFDLAHGDYGTKIDPDGDELIEIKVGGAMPLWMAQLFSAYEIYPVSFSKYGQTYSMTHQWVMTGKYLTAPNTVNGSNHERGRIVCSRAF